MKRRWKLCLGAFVLIAAAITAVGIWLARSSDQARKQVQETARLLQQQGYKIELSEFPFSASKEMRATTDAISAAVQASRNRRPFGAAGPVPRGGTNVSLATRRSRPPAADNSEDAGPKARAAMDEDRELVAAACAALMAHSIRFEPLMRGRMLYPHLPDLKAMSRILSERLQAALDEGKPSEAWTNWLALTRLATAWEPEPADISHRVRYHCAEAAAQAT